MHHLNLKQTVVDAFCCCRKCKWAGSEDLTVATAIT